MFQALSGGAYQARSLIAAAQRCLNLYVEPVAQSAGEPIPVAHYPTPGLTLQASAPQLGCRGLYTAFNGTLYACYGQEVLTIDESGTWTSLGTLTPSAPSDSTQRDTPVSMCDNGNLLLVVDGSVDGWFVDLSKPVASQVLTQIDRNLNAGWLGSDSVSFQDTFFLLNSPGTAIYYISLSNINADSLTAAFSLYSEVIVTGGTGYSVGDVLTIPNTGSAQITVNTVSTKGAITASGVTSGGAVNTVPPNPVSVTGGTGKGATFTATFTANTGGFDPLDFAAMTAQANNLVAAVSVRRDLWTIGTSSYEIWVNSGGDGTAAGSFPFQIFPHAFGNWGCVAKYSIATIMNQVFWLSRDKYGQGMIVLGEALNVKRISTHAIEYAISEYPSIDDAIGMCYQQNGHLFYLLTFPSAHNDRGATWVYDVSTEQFHERCYIDNNGIEYRHLANAVAGAYGHVYVGDWRNGNLYTFDNDNYSDNGMPIKRLRSFPHQIDLEANRRVMYHQLIAQIQVGSESKGSQTGAIVNTDFDAPDNTLLQDFYNINSQGASFTDIGSVPAVILNDAVTAQSAGEVLYTVNTVPTSPDYTVEFTMTPTLYTALPSSGDSMFVIGRANANNYGYEAAIVSDGTQYFGRLSVLHGPAHGGGGIEIFVPLGTLSSGNYQVTLSMQGTAISMSVFRSQDGKWMGSTGQWVGSPSSALSLTDSTYTSTGKILLGGTWDILDHLVPLSGTQTTSAIGTLVTNLFNALSIVGQQASSGIGSPSALIAVPTIIPALVGQVASSAVGNINYGITSANLAVTMLGQQSNTGLGSPTALATGGTITVAPLGQASVSHIGSLTLFNGKALNVSGVVTTAGLGTLGKTSTSHVSLTGQHATSGLGTLSVTETTGSLESPSGTSILTSGSIIASSTAGVPGSQNTITLVNGQIYVNGTLIANTHGASDIQYWGHSAWQLADQWYGPIVFGDGGGYLPNTLSANSAPQPVITLSQTNFAPTAGSNPGELIGTVNVTAAGNYSLITLTLSGAQASDFSFSNTSHVTTITVTNGVAVNFYAEAGVSLPASPPDYAITFTATLAP